MKRLGLFKKWFKALLTLQAPTPQNGQIHSNSSSATTDELFECVWPLCGLVLKRVKVRKLYIKHLKTSSFSLQIYLRFCSKPTKKIIQHITWTLLWCPYCWFWASTYKLDFWKLFLSTLNRFFTIIKVFNVNNI